ncbi:MAG: putative porin [Caulobacteraceae bacterium]|nr:putative porin [Caulobacteraceae bacterium]
MATAPATPPPAPAAAPAPPPPSESMVINLVRLLVKQGVITQDAADALKQQAEDEATQARLAAGAQPPAAAPPGVVRVPYVPLIVRNQIRDEIKQDVLAQAQAEGWASPGALPSWINRIEWSGDFRFRDQSNFYSGSNIVPFIDYAAFNANGPIDINAITNPNGLPFLNTREDRLNQLSIRARLAARAKIFEGVSAGVRLATGGDGSPVSTTQLLGGGLSKKAIWLDQAYLTLTPIYWGALTVGRMPNPFDHTDNVFDEDLNFDGVAATATSGLPFGPAGLKGFATAGAFPIDYVSSNFPTAGAVKAGDRTKWLFAGQIGAEYKPDELSWSIRGAVAYYTYRNIQGVLSDPCGLFDGNKQCSSDQSRPSFLQKGNTLFLIRDILPDPNNPLNTPQPQFVGLSYDYDLLDVTAAFEMPVWGPARLQLVGDYTRNLAFDPARIFANPLTQPVTNFDFGPGGVLGPYHSGQNAWLAKATIGYPRAGTRGDWNLAFGYKYIEPDAVLDAFTDSDFHLGGTNARGYFVSGSYFFANNTWISGRWLSANQVFGPPLAIDVLQLELNTRF